MERMTAVATFFEGITDEQAALIRNASLFFIASVDPALGHGPEGQGPVNLSPKGGVPLHILSPSRVAYLDYAGSGNETARHASAGGPITVMICSFEVDNAAIVRLYGTATITPLADSPLAELLLEHPATEIRLPMRQVVDITVERSVTSCGYGVPVLELVRERTRADRGRDYKESRTLKTVGTGD
jgi:hypothetical protein